MEYLDYTEWFRTRLSQLRMDAGVSARDMSLSLGQSESYINKIENRRTLPSMKTHAAADRAHFAARP